MDVLAAQITSLNDCLPNLSFRRRSKKTSKLRVTGLCAGNSPVTGEFPAQRASNVENVSIWWRRHGSHNNWTHGIFWPYSLTLSLVKPDRLDEIHCCSQDDDVCFIHLASWVFEYLIWCLVFIVSIIEDKKVNKFQCFSCEISPALLLRDFLNHHRDQGVDKWS